ncbi:MAG: PAS domain S-box protein [Acidobacteriota bacterium]|nr:PAS domain S-box protein [Acidobacteriota bacterium]
MNTSSETDADLLRAEIAALRTRLSRYEPEPQIEDLKDHANISEATINQLNQFAVILESITDAFFALDDEWRFTYLNQEAERVLLRRREDLLGKNVWDEFAPAVGGTFHTEYLRARREGVTVKFEEYYPPLGAWLEVSAYPLPDGLAVFFQDVGDRKRSEAALRESETRFRSFFDVAATGMSVARVPDGRFIEVNKKLCSMLGYTPEELLRKSFVEITHPDDVDTNRQLYRDLVEHRIPQFEYEKRFLSRNGDPVWVHVTVSAVCNDLGSPVHTIGVIEDIGERKRTEQALRESEQHFRSLAEALPQLVWTSLPSGSCDYLSSQWVEYTGIPEQDQLGLRWLDLVMHPDDREVTYRAWMAAVADEAAYDLEYRLRRADGVYRWFKTRGTPVRDSSERIVRWFGTCTDIDDQRSAEEERKQMLAREQVARATAELLNRIGPMLLSELDSAALIQRVTDIATELVRAEIGSFFHNVVDERGESYMLYSLSGVPREAFAKFPMPRNTAVFGPTFRGEGVVLSGDITKDPRYGHTAPHYGIPQGHLPVKSYLAAPVISRSGEVLGGLFFGHSQPEVFSQTDAEVVTGIAAQAAIALDNARLFAASERAQEALRQSNQELQHANADLEQFAFAAAHDLQEPLRMVTSYTQLLERALKGTVEKRLQDYLEYIVSGSKRMTLLLHDLLAYTETSRDSEVPSAPVDLNRALAQSLRNLDVAISESSAIVSSADLPEVVGRSTHFVQLFQNLVGNAIKYAKAGVVPRISISVEPAQDDWLLKVSDNGMGIEPEYHKQVFGVFKRLHGSEIPGTGIGLAICQRVVERAGGQIWVESEAGLGAAFCFRLPRLA